MVAPFLVGKNNPLYSVNDVYNGIFVHGNVLGDAMFYGSGAGKLPTASAVVADVVDEAKHLHENMPNEWNDQPLPLADPDQVSGTVPCTCADNRSFADPECIWDYRADTGTKGRRRDRLCHCTDDTWHSTKQKQQRSKRRSFP